MLVGPVASQRQRTGSRGRGASGQIEQRCTPSDSNAADDRPNLGASHAFVACRRGALHDAALLGGGSCLVLSHFRGAGGRPLDQKFGHRPARSATAGLLDQVLTQPRPGLRCLALRCVMFDDGLRGPTKSSHGVIVEAYGPGFPLAAGRRAAAPWSRDVMCRMGRHARSMTKE